MVSTAHLAKFREIVEPLIGREVPVPEALARLFARPDSRFFKQQNVDRAEAFFERNGSKTVVLCRFVPVVRTFATVIAGVARMDARKFFVLNVLGALPWAVGVTLLGYGLGDSVPNIDRYLLPIIAVIIILSLMPIAFEVRRARTARRTANG